MRDARLLQIVWRYLTRWWREGQEFFHNRVLILKQLWESRYCADENFFLLNRNRYVFLNRLGQFLRRSSVFAVLAVICLTLTIGYPLYNQPLLKVGMPAPQEFIAPDDALIVDSQKTREKRDRVSHTSGEILIIDEAKNQEIERKLLSILEKGDEIRLIAGKFPFVELSELTESSQQFLRTMSDQEWELLKQSLNSPQPNVKNLARLSERLFPATVSNNKINSKINNQVNLYSPHNNNSAFKPEIVGIEHKSNQQLTTQNACAEGGCVLKAQSTSVETPVEGNRPRTEFIQTLEELKTHKIAPISNFSVLLVKIADARVNYTKANQHRLKFLRANPDHSEIFANSLIIDLLDQEWENIKTVVTRGTKQIITQGIHRGLAPKIIEDAIALHLETISSETGQKLSQAIVSEVIEPNLKVDIEKTRKQQKQAVERVEPVTKRVVKDEVIVRRNKLLTQLDIDILEYYNFNRRDIYWRELLQLILIVAVSVVLFARIMWQSKYRWRQRDRLLILLLILTVAGFLAIASRFHFTYAPWSTLGLLMGSFYGSFVGSWSILLLAVNLSFGLDIGWSSLIGGAVAALVAANIAPKLRSREELALLGVAIAVIEGGIYLLIKLLIGTVFGSLWYEVLQKSLFLGVSGFAWSIVALGLSPYLEQLFDIVTPIRLAELANPNRPLLKRLAAETPGTFQHTLLVSSLAEAAARKLGCNVELVRAGTLYHDIGKMHDPLAFIENQMGRPNKHDTEIKDPWVSAAIIKKHVTEGLVIARRHRLPTAIQAFIPEHQGTMAIAYFYHQAQKFAQENSHIQVNAEDFCYDGPIPQSRETGIVMLADSCEAALRSLQDATPEQALVMLNNILRARWKENQLLDSGLTRAEMSVIAEVFVEVWQQFHHKRIPYPKQKSVK